MRRRIFIALIAASCVAGCAPTPKKPEEPIPQLQLVETLETDADRLLDYYAYMINLQGDTLLREYRNVKKENEENPNDFNNMQLIMLLSSPSAPFRNTQRAHAMLEQWLRDDYHRYSKLRPLALLFDNYLSEMSRQSVVINQTRKDLRQSKEDAARQARELGAAQEHSKELQEKLDALMEMERNLIERQQVTQPDKP
jgi:hypothetical protein